MNRSLFAHLPEDRYFEDYLPGDVHEFGSISVDEDEVLEFGRRYVPLSYHIDKEAAKNSIYGGVWGSAGFQSLYDPAPATLLLLPLMPEWYLVIVALALLSALGASWPPLLWGTAFCWGAVGGALYTLTMVRVAHDFAASSAIAGAAAMIAGYTAGCAVGPAVSGAMLDRWGVVGQSLWLTLLAGAVLMVALRGEFRRSPAA